MASPFRRMRVLPAIIAALALPAVAIGAEAPFAAGDALSGMVIHPGDLITQLNGSAPRSFIDFNKRLIDIKDDTDVTLVVQRGTEKKTLSFRQVPEDTFFNAELIRKKLGMSVQELTPELAVGMGMTRMEGLLVGGVDRGGPAATAHMDKGMLITGLDGQSTSSVVTAAKLIYAKAKGDKVKFDLIVPRQRGPFIELARFIAEVTVK